MVSCFRIFPHLPPTCRLLFLAPLVLDCEDLLATVVGKDQSGLTGETAAESERLRTERDIDSSRIQRVLGCMVPIGQLVPKLGPQVPIISWNCNHESPTTLSPVTGPEIPANPVRDDWFGGWHLPEVVWESYRNKIP